jgi:hypothetical protein
VRCEVPAGDGGTLELYQCNGELADDGTAVDAIVTAEAYEAHARRYYTPRSVERAARANGFRIVDSHTISLQNRVPYRFYLAAMPIQRRGSRRDVLRDS